MAGSSYSRTVLINALVHAFVAFQGVVFRTIEYCIARFEPTVEHAVAEVCRVGHSLKTGVYSFVVKVSGKLASACDGFVSMRRSLDASAEIAYS